MAKMPRSNTFASKYWLINYFNSLFFFFTKSHTPHLEAMFSIDARLVSYFTLNTAATNCNERQFL